MQPQNDPRLAALSEVPFLELAGDRSIKNGNSLPMATTDQVMLVLSDSRAFQTYSANNTPCNNL